MHRTTLCQAPAAITRSLLGADRSFSTGDKETKAEGKIIIKDTPTEWSGTPSLQYKLSENENSHTAGDYGLTRRRRWHARIRESSDPQRQTIEG